MVHKRNADRNETSRGVPASTEVCPKLRVRLLTTAVLRIPEPRRKALAHPLVRESPPSRPRIWVASRCPICPRPADRGWHPLGVRVWRPVLFPVLVYVYPWLPSGDVDEALGADALAGDQVDVSSAFVAGRAGVFRERYIGVVETEAVCFESQGAADAGEGMLLYTFLMATVIRLSYTYICGACSMMCRYSRVVSTKLMACLDTRRKVVRVGISMCLMIDHNNSGGSENVRRP